MTSVDRTTPEPDRQIEDIRRRWEPHGSRPPARAPEDIAWLLALVEYLSVERDNFALLIQGEWAKVERLEAERDSLAAKIIAVRRGVDEALIILDDLAGTDGGDHVEYTWDEANSLEQARELLRAVLNAPSVSGGEDPKP